jgi:hypothetical protein
MDLPPIRITQPVGLREATLLWEFEDYHEVSARPLGPEAKLELAS